ncbi:GNAT superfamily N-acetyltransferase [Prauserella sediminis]|uniref:GNAT superfamily N-acetyltransferase n=1 Tax=Prauserella sediminis TaxID=577680 RepID=A0A839XIZ8_9PSEU|nr:GNAT family N-acetyltransferase [Prauserella sediminis]MBB3662731.1 GNAT superfamily N-acetyltransferase [Prauserella sediminis]
MSRRIVGVTLDNLEQLPQHCRRCVYWELAPHLKQQAEEFGETEVEKEAWVSGVLLEWGSCGRIVYSGRLPVGFVLYAPPNAVPRSDAFPTSPPSPDAVLLTAFHILPEFRGSGLGRMLVQAVAKDLTRRGVKAIEAFGDAGPEEPDIEAQGAGSAFSGAESSGMGSPSTASSGTESSGARTSGGAGDDDGHSCVVPAAFLQSVGFKTVRPHPRWPRLRLELRSSISWKEDVEAALEKLLGEVTMTTATSSSSRA